MPRHSGLLLGAALSLAVATGCGGETAAPSSGAEPQLPQTSDPVELDPADFSADIDNRYWPMESGTRWTYREIDEEGTVVEVVVTATSETKEIANGVTARVVRDTVTEDGEVIEDTFDWYAQDSDGTIWYLGENTAEFEDGKVATREGSFEAGVDGALPGVIMPGDPEVGMAYRQEYYEGEAEDNGEILSLEEMAEVPLGQVRRRAPDQGHHHDRARRARVQALRPRCRSGAGVRGQRRRRTRGAGLAQHGLRRGRRGRRDHAARQALRLTRTVPVSPSDDVGRARRHRSRSPRPPADRHS